MKNYVVSFDVDFGKIGMIKLIRDLTGMGLKESKDFVEARIENFEFPATMEVILTERQFGKFLILHTMNPRGAYNLIKIEEVSGRRIDLTYLNIRPMNEHTEANAKLIAAAPELLEACKEVLSVLPVLWGDQVKNGKITLSIDESVFYQLESAINKTKGV